MNSVVFLPISSSEIITSLTSCTSDLTHNFVIASYLTTSLFYLFPQIIRRGRTVIVVFVGGRVELAATLSGFQVFWSSYWPMYFFALHQGSSDQPPTLSQHPGVDVSGWQHLHHLLCGGALSETGAGEAGADAMGEEWGSRADPTSSSFLWFDYSPYNGVPRSQWKWSPDTDPFNELITVTGCWSVGLPPGGFRLRDHKWCSPLAA